jgi:UrcA family protein
MTRISLSALTFAAVVAASPVLSAPLSVWNDDEKVAVKVAYQDAELRSPAGAARLAFRIRTAARQACGGDNLLVTTGFRFLRCQHRAIDQALATLDAPLVADALGRAPATAVANR